MLLELIFGQEIRKLQSTLDPSKPPLPVAVEKQSPDGKWDIPGPI